MRRRDNLNKLRERVRDKINYEPDTGRFFWNLSKWDKEIVSEIYSYSDQYNYVMIDYDQLSLHQIAFLLMTGHIPLIIHHIDEDRGNNKWNNLEDVTPSKHAKKHVWKLRKNNTSGVCGIAIDIRYGCWQVHASKNKKQVCRSGFVTKESAALKRYQMEKEFGYPNPKENTAYKYLEERGLV